MKFSLKDSVMYSENEVKISISLSVPKKESERYSDLKDRLKRLNRKARLSVLACSNFIEFLDSAEEMIKHQEDNPSSGFELPRGAA